MSAISQRFAFETQRSLAFGAIGVGYAGVGTSLDHPARMIYIQNLTDATLQFSLDGINDHFPLPTNGFLLLDITTNQTKSTNGFFLAEGQRLYVKQLGVPTLGSVYFSVIYGKES